MRSEPAIPILLLDDDPGVIGVLRRHLEGAGYRVRTAGSGTEGLEAIEQEPPRLVIADIYMPDMDGVEFIARLQSRHPTVPVIAISGGGYIERDDALELARRMGAKTTLAKPIARDALLQAVQRMLSELPSE